MIDEHHQPTSFETEAERHPMRWVLICYATSLALPAIKTTGNFGTLWGVQAFVGSLLAMVDGYPYWLANPALWVGLYFFHSSRWRTAAICGLAATLFALSVPVIMYLEDQRNLPPAGLTSTLMPGYYVWLASPVLLAFWSVRRWLADGTLAASDTKSVSHL